MNAHKTNHQTAERAQYQLIDGKVVANEQASDIENQLYDLQTKKIILDCTKAGAIALNVFVKLPWLKKFSFHYFSKLTYTTDNRFFRDVVGVIWDVEVTDQFKLNPEAFATDDIFPPGSKLAVDSLMRQENAYFEICKAMYEDDELPHFAHCALDKAKVEGMIDANNFSGFDAFKAFFPYAASLLKLGS